MQDPGRSGCQLDQQAVDGAVTVSGRTSEHTARRMTRSGARQSTFMLLCMSSGGANDLSLPPLFLDRLGKVVEAMMTAVPVGC